ncbi:MAG: hypothetical protein HOC77_12265 [Chloroflexi bacterium]|jgi:hypothetical protein|nr:hypothetical protein [Chloroflexota bacterium]MBT4074752.1 hypothetical protein [Chloroflexota bacterium]MBT4515849.1 hypothetical protein [Chloroflexota bacterium]MBT6681615.1 hypothetical protein [Chloroflexota bacterium]
MTADSLILRLPSSTQSVSAFHSLLRTTQAAAREAAQSSPEGAAAFASSPAPQLIFEVTDASDDGLSLEFRFAEASAEHAPHPVSAMAFEAFLDGLSSYIKSSPMRTLWGDVPTRGERSGQESGPLDDRMEQVLSELERLGDIELSSGVRRIRLTSGGVEITP